MRDPNCVTRRRLPGLAGLAALLLLSALTVSSGGAPAAYALGSDPGDPPAGVTGVRDGDPDMPESGWPKSGAPRYQTTAEGDAGVSPAENPTASSSPRSRFPAWLQEMLERVRVLKRALVR